MYTYKIKEIAKVVDGDTIDVIIDLGFGLTKKERVRIAGIDAPESRTRDLYEKKLGLEAKYWLKEHIEYCDNAIIKTEKEGKYGRILGWLYTDEFSISLNDVMIEKGYAWEYDGGSKEKDYKELEIKRKSNGSWVE
jgi:endonuclease YncB( thermonuclease family)